MNNSDNNKDIDPRIKQQNIKSMKLSSFLEKFLRFFLLSLQSLWPFSSFIPIFLDKEACDFRPWSFAFDFRL